MKNLNENWLLHLGLGLFFAYVAIVIVLIFNLLSANLVCEVAGITMILIYFVLPIAVLSLIFILAGSFKRQKNVENAQKNN